MSESHLVDSCLVVLVFSPGDEPIDCLNKAMAFLTAVAFSRKGLLNARTVKMKDIWLGNALSLSDQGMLHDPRVLDSQAVQSIIPNNVVFQTEDLDTFDSDCADISNAKAVLMANISNYGSDVISEIKPTLYDGIVISNKHVAIPVIDDEETLILEEVSRSKMFEKEKDPEAIKQKISHKSIDYVKLNKLYEDFGNRFVPQQELLADQVFWYHMLNPSTKSSDALPIKIEAPKELSKVMEIYPNLARTQYLLVNCEMELIWGTQARNSRSDVVTKQHHSVSSSFGLRPGSASRVNENQDENDEGNEGTSNPNRSSTPSLTPLHNLFLMQITHTYMYVVPFHTRKLFTTLRENSPSFSGRIVPLFDTMLVPQDEGSGTPTKPHHTPSPEAQQISSATPSLSTLLSSSALPPVADEPASPLRDVSQGEACLTDSGFGADQDRANIAKTSTLPHDSALRELAINMLKARVKLLKDIEGGGAERSKDDAPIKGRNLDEGEAAAERVSDDTEEMATVLTSMDASTVLASKVAKVPTSSGSIPTVDPLAAEVPTGSKETMVEFETLKKKKVQEQIDAQVARELEEQMAREDQRISEQVARDAEIVRIHAKEELQIMIDGLDMKSFKSKGIRFKQESAKKLKTSEEVPEEVKLPDEVPEEKVKEMMQLVPIEEVTRLGGSSASYQFFVDMLKHLDMEDLNQLWALVNESLSIRPPTSDKEMELWVELKRLYEPDDEDQLWTHT
nr:hypothetical protein [Tanacetum cinerariifolium]